MSCTSATTVLLVLLLAVPCAAASGGDAPQDVERTARLFVALSHDGAFHALAPLSLDRVPGKEQYERRIRNILRVRCLRLEGIGVRELTATAGHAAIELELFTTKSDLWTPDLGSTEEITSLRLHMIRDSGRWLVSAIELPDEELADAILAGRPHDPERITAAVARIVARRARERMTGNDYSKARSASELAREIARVAGDPRAEVEALGTLVSTTAIPDRGLAQQLMSEAMALAQAAGDPDTLTWAWYARGNLESAADQHSASAEAAYRQALVFAERAENPQFTINALHVLGSRAFLRGDHFTARVLLERSLPLIRENGDWPGAVWYDLLLSYIYWVQDDHDRSFHHLRRGLALAEQNQAWVVPWALLRLAEMYIAQERLDDALAVIERTRPLIQLKAGLHAAMLAHLAAIEAKRGNLGEAECLTREAVVGWERGGYGTGPDVDVLLPRLADTKQYGEMLRLSLERASHVQERVPVELVKSLTFAAEAYRALGFSERAAAVIAEAIDVQEALHEQIAGGEEQQVRSSERTAASYELAAAIALDRGEVADALACIERGRGRVLYDTLRRSPFPSDTTESNRALQRRHEEILARLRLSLDAARERPAEAAALREQLDTARHEYQSFLDGTRAHEQRSASAHRKIDAVAIRESLRGLPRGLVAVEYVLHDEQLHTFVVRRDGSDTPRITLHTTRIDRAALDRLAGTLVGTIAKRNLRYRAAAAEAYALLLAPVERQIAAADTLLIVPDDILWRIPFAALLDGAGRFAVERWAIVYAPSVSVYVAMAGMRGKTRSPAAGVLAFANPVLERQSTQELGSFYRGLSVGPLPDAEREADALCALYGRRCVVMKGSDATETRARGAIAGNRIVHFATHGVLDDRNPMYSRLILGRGDGPADDGALEAWEIARLPVDAELVVLSACDTARGTIGGGEGVVGMAWAFFVAGARSTIATQWKISSEASADLMIAFHRALREQDGGGLRKARALRRAQLRMLRDAKTKHPFYWAAFVILGDAS